ncbi:MAG TPA: hypothetical protein VF533_13655 [Solirubrobacteraceae bacterium]|jgi:hypothetical protein
MLSDDVERVRRDPGPAILTAAVGVLIGVLLGAVLIGTGEAAKPASTTVPASRSPAGKGPKETKKHDGPKGTAKEAEMAPASAGTNGTQEQLGLTGAPSPQLKKALEEAVLTAKPVGRLELAVWANGWSDAAVAPPSAKTAQSRMWSMSKPVTAVALMEALDGRAPEDHAFEAMQGALIRSENCRQRRVVLELQKHAGGADKAAARIRSVLERAGASPDVNIPLKPEGPEDAQCDAVLRGLGADPASPALQLGTAEWTVRDGAAFARALAAREYGKAGETPRRLMMRPKDRSHDPGVTDADYSVSPEWGARREFSRFPDLAFKGGWGGRRQKRYLVGQIVSMTIHGVPVGVMGVFHPNVQPTVSDDPGDTKGPEEIERAFGTIAPVLDRTIRK